MDLRVFEMSQHTIRRQHQDVPSLRRKLRQIRRRIIFRAQRASNNVLRRRKPGLLHGHDAPSHLLHHQRVIFRELQQCAVPHQVDATVPNVGDRELAIFKAGRHQGGAHARGTSVPLRILKDVLIRLVHRI